MSLPWAIEELLPHDHPMILIDEVMETEMEFQSLTRISEDSPFFETGRGVPSYVGIEYIAQTVGALIGLRAIRSGAAVQVGYLLGARSYEASLPYFPLGMLLTTSVSSEIESGRIAKYKGIIRDYEGRAMVQTSLTLYSATDADVEDGTA